MRQIVDDLLATTARWIAPGCALCSATFSCSLLELGLRMEIELQYDPAEFEPRWAKLMAWFAAFVAQFIVETKGRVLEEIAP